jgi:diphthamide biosynthesis enzyme Dph1/Dph2-like protein
MERYDFEIDKLVSAVKKEKAKKILLQLPDGLKPMAIEILDV